MSKIVVLCGSVRKNGNTEMLARAFCDGARLNNEVDFVSVADFRVLPCIGCNTCFEREGNACFQNDDMQAIYRKLADADMLVIASPVYFYGISAQLKAVIDRLHTPLRNTFRIRKTALLLVAAATLPEVFDSIKTQYRLVCSFFNLEDAGSVCVRGVREKGDIAGNPALAEARALGSSLV